MIIYMTCTFFCSRKGWSKKLYHLISQTGGNGNRCHEGKASKSIFLIAERKKNIKKTELV